MSVHLGSLAVIFVTYVFGDLEIHGWLLHSVNRTTIFAQLVLYTEITVWLVIAAEGAFGRAPARAEREPPPASARLPDVLDDSCQSLPR